MTLSPGVSATYGIAHAGQASAQSWLVLKGDQLCRVWSAGGAAAATTTQSAPTTQSTQTSAANGTTVHCTRAWHVNAAGMLVTDDPNWVPTSDGDMPVDDSLSLGTTRHHVLLISHPAAPKSPAKMSAKVLTAPAPAPHPPASSGSGYNPWGPVPGYQSYAMSDFAGDPWAGYFGYCTWYAWYRHQSEPLLRLGNAAAWAWNAPNYGLRTGSVPAVGATAVFQPGVEGAGAGGHVAHVEAVLGNGWFLISEMDFGLNGGGWGRVNYRYAYTAPGVSFIY